MNFNYTEMKILNLSFGLLRVLKRRNKRHYSRIDPPFLVLGGTLLEETPIKHKTDDFPLVPCSRTYLISFTIHIIYYSK